MLVGVDDTDLKLYYNIFAIMIYNGKELGRCVRHKYKDNAMTGKSFKNDV